MDAAKDYICVRVLDMSGVDLNLYRFDYDLTFAVLLMNGDGTTYHRYGTRDHLSPTGRLSMTSLVKLLKETLEDHAAYQKAPRPPGPRSPRPIEELPAMVRKLKSEKIECFHCHMVNDAEHDQAWKEKRYEKDAVVGSWPLPDRVGLKLGRDEQTRLEGVAPASPAEKAGLRAGDRLVRFGGERVRTQMDVQWVLEQAGAGDGSIPIEFSREGSSAPQAARLEVKKGWKLADDLGFSWRASMWQLRPRPGFGGGQLKARELEELKLAPGAWAIKVGYIVDWGDEAFFGRSARQAGIKKGDVILSAGGKSDFLSERHFQSWFRFHQKPGTRVPLEILRKGERIRVELPVLE